MRTNKYGKERPPKQFENHVGFLLYQNRNLLYNSLGGEMGIKQCALQWMRLDEFLFFMKYTQGKNMPGRERLRCRTVGWIAVCQAVVVISA